MITIIAMFMSIVPWGLLFKFTEIPQVVGVGIQLLGLGLMLGIGLSGKWMDI